MFKKTKEKLLTVLAVALALVLAAPVLLPQTNLVAQAASKPTVYLDNGYGFLQPDLQWTLGINETVKVVVENKKPKASYSFSSSSKSVATVSKKGVITGKKVGTAKITVNQKYKGKTTKIDTVKVTVKKAKLYSEDTKQNNGYYVSAQPGYISKENPCKFSKPKLWVQYANPKAKYAFYSDSDDLVISKDGVVTEVKKSGKANLIVKETYKGKTRTLGKIPMELKNPTYNGEDIIQLNIGDKFDFHGDGFDTPNLIQAVGRYYFFRSGEAESDEEILDFANNNSDSDDVKVFKENGEWEGQFLAQTEGTVNCALLQWNYLEQNYDKVFGRFQIKVSDASSLTDFQFPWEREKVEEDVAYGDEDDEVQYTYSKETNSLEADLYTNYEYAEDLMDYNYEGGIALFMKQLPAVYYGDYKVKSSNPEVVSATVDEDSLFDANHTGSMDILSYIRSPENCHKNGMYLNLGFHKAGKSTITVEAGGVTKSFVINVMDDGNLHPESEKYYLAWESDSWDNDEGYDCFYFNKDKNQLIAYPEEKYFDEFYNEWICYISIDSNLDEDLGSFEITSSDPSVIKAWEGEGDEYAPRYLLLDPQKPGTATITIKYKGIEKKVDVVLYDDTVECPYGDDD